MNLKKDTEEASFLKSITTFLHNLENDTFTTAELIAALQERSFGILMLLIAIPNVCLIASIPMVSIVFGLLLIFVSIQIILRYPKIILPKMIGQKAFSKKQLEHILKVYSLRLIQIEKYLKPRWSFLTTGMWEVIIGIVSLLHGILITLPIPLGNFLPGIALLFIALGIISRDGLFIIIGHFLSIAIFLFFYSSSIFLYNFMQHIYSYVKQFSF